MIKKFLVLAITTIVVLFFSILENSNSYNKSWNKNTDIFNILIKKFIHKIENIWRLDKVLTASFSKDYIKCINIYQTVNCFNFEKGLFIIEIIKNTKPIEYLRNVVINTFLINSNYKKINFYPNINENINVSKQNFLNNQIFNYSDNRTNCENRAIKFANFLLQNHLKEHLVNLKVIYGLTINLLLPDHHFDKRAHKYLNIVRQASRKYGVDESLILAIMQTESSFNPYAVSRSDALGLMQVVQHSAGQDVFRAQGKFGTPSRSYLFDPAGNIDTGTAYLAMLNNIYFSRIENPTSRRYAVITAYNGGVSSVLRVFSNNKIQAANIINNMSPGDVYFILTTRHPSIESRCYLYKVDAAQKNYWRK